MLRGRPTCLAHLRQARPDTLLVESLLADDIANDANDANGGHAWDDVRHDVHHPNCTGLCSERDGICQYEENLAAEATYCDWRPNVGGPLEWSPPFAGRDLTRSPIASSEEDEAQPAEPDLAAEFESLLAAHEADQASQ